MGLMGRNGRESGIPTLFQWTTGDSALILPGQHTGMGRNGTIREGHEIPRPSVPELRRSVPARRGRTVPPGQPGRKVHGNVVLSRLCDLRLSSRSRYGQYSGLYGTTYVPPGVGRRCRGHGRGRCNRARPAGGVGPVPVLIAEGLERIGFRAQEIEPGGGPSSSL